MRGDKDTLAKQKIDTKTKYLLKKAEELHGHFGPFLVVGARMGQVGLKRLGMSKHTNSLRVSLSVPFKVPYSCAVDGVQISTKCTIGNQKLQLKNADKIEACLEDLSKKRKITIAPQPTVLTMLEKQVVAKNLSDDEICKMAWRIASMPETGLFSVKNG